MVQDVVFVFCISDAISPAQGANYISICHEKTQIFSNNSEDEIIQDISAEENLYVQNLCRRGIYISNELINPIVVVLSS